MNALVFTVQNNMVVFCHQARFQQRQKNNAGGQRRRDEMTSKLIKALILTTVLCYGQKNWLENPSLKAQPDGSIPGWTAYRGTSGAPMHVDYENKLSGKNSVWGEYYKGKVPEGREAGLKTPAQFDVLTENYFPFGIMQDVTSKSLPWKQSRLEDGAKRKTSSPYASTASIWMWNTTTAPSIGEDKPTRRLNTRVATRPGTFLTKTSQEN